MKSRSFGFIFSLSCCILLASSLVAQEAPVPVDAVVKAAPELLSPKPIAMSPVEVLFFSGYRLSGKLKQMEEDLLEIEYAGSPTLMKMPADRICSLYFSNQQSSPPSVSLPDSLVFISGLDVIPCKVHELTADNLLVTTEYKENMLISREQVASFSLGSVGSKDIFDGATVIDATWISAIQEQLYKDTGRAPQFFRDLEPFVKGKDKGILLSSPKPPLAKDLGLDSRCFDFSVCLDFSPKGEAKAGEHMNLTFVFGGFAEDLVNGPSVMPQGAQGNNVRIALGTIPSEEQRTQVKTGITQMSVILLEVQSERVQLVLRRGEIEEVLAEAKVEGEQNLLNLSLNVRWCGTSQLSYELRVNNDPPQVVKGVEGVPLGNGFAILSAGSFHVNMVNPRLSVQASSFAGKEVRKTKGVLTKEEDFLPFEVESLSGDPLIVTLRGAEKSNLKTIPASYIAQVVLNLPEKKIYAAEGMAELNLVNSSRLQGRVKEIKEGILLLEHPYVGEIAIPLQKVNRVLMPQVGPHLIKSKP